jgi:hypothetical protein
MRHTDYHPFRTPYRVLFLDHMARTLLTIQVFLQADCPTLRERWRWATIR